MNVEQTLTITQQVVTIIIIPAVAALAPTVKRFIDAHTTAKQRAIAEAIVTTAVHSTEQQYPNLAGDKKYIVAAQKINKELGDKLTPKQVNDLIDSTVNQMNIAIGKIPTTSSNISVEQPTA